MNRDRGKLFVQKNPSSPAGFVETAFRLSGVATEIPPQISCENKDVDENNITSVIYYPILTCNDSIKYLILNQ